MIHKKGHSPAGAGAGLAAQRRAQPVAPAVYRPNPAPKALQPKAGQTPAPQPFKPGGRTPLAPPAYRPQPVPKVLQTKTAPGAPARQDASGRWPFAPQVPRPSPHGVAQAKRGKPVTPAKTPCAPPAYRPLPTPRCLQAKTAAGRTTPHHPSKVSAASLLSRVGTLQPRMAAGSRPPGPARLSAAGVIQRFVPNDMKGVSEKGAYHRRATGVEQGFNLFADNSNLGWLRYRWANSDQDEYIDAFANNSGHAEERLIAQAKQMAINPKTSPTAFNQNRIMELYTERKPCESNNAPSNRKGRNQNNCWAYLNSELHNQIVVSWSVPYSNAEVSKLLLAYQDQFNADLLRGDYELTERTAKWINTRYDNYFTTMTEGVSLEDMNLESFHGADIHEELNEADLHVNEEELAGRYY